MTTGTTFARGSALGAAASLIRVLPLGDGQQLFTHRRIGKGVDPRVEAAPADGARQVCAELRDRHPYFLPMLCSGSQNFGCCVLADTGIAHSEDCSIVRVNSM